MHEIQDQTNATSEKASRVSYNHLQALSFFHVSPIITHLKSLAMSPRPGSKTQSQVQHPELLSPSLL